MQEMPSNQSQQIASCELCKGDHQSGFCPPVEEEVNYMGNQDQGYQQRQPYQNNQGYHQRNNQGYQQGWRQDANNQNRQSPYQNTNQNSQPQARSSNLQDTLAQFMQASMENQKSNEETIKNLETQVGKLAKQLADQNVGSSFSANTQSNPKEHCKAILTRSGRVVENGVGKGIEIKDVVEEKELEE